MSKELKLTILLPLLKNTKLQSNNKLEGKSTKKLGLFSTITEIICNNLLNSLLCHRTPFFHWMGKVDNQIKQKYFKASKWEIS
jgi:hypothetical protein